MNPGEPVLGELARDHLLHPRNTGGWPGEVTDLPRASGEAGSATSGAFVRFRMALDSGRIVAVRYEVLGGPSLLAAASWLSEHLTGKPAAAESVPAGLEMARTLELERAEHGMGLLVENAALDALKASGEARILSHEA